MFKFIKKVLIKKHLKVTQKEVSVTSERSLEDTSNVSEELIQLAAYSVLIKAPLFIKVTYILNSINDFYDDKESKLNLNMEVINNILKNNHYKYDYNINVPEKFNTLDDLYNLRLKMFMAVSDLLPYYKSYCKQCNTLFTLKYGELDFYQKHDLKIPTHCKKCIKERKKN